jgi:uncharacterized protein YggT (Ycf19 family)
LLPLSAGPLDLSPMIGIVALIVAWQVVVGILGQLH